MSSSIKEAIRCIHEGNLKEMKEHIEQTLSQKAVDKLEEKKLQIANSYFGKE